MRFDLDITLPLGGSALAALKAASPGRGIALSVLICDVQESPKDHIGTDDARPSISSATFLRCRFRFPTGGEILCLTFQQRCQIVNFHARSRFGELISGQCKDFAARPVSPF